MSYASLFIVATGRSALALGGDQGWDRVITPARLMQFLAQNDVRFLLPANSTGGAAAAGSPMQNVNTDLYAWVCKSCSTVPGSGRQSSAATAATTATARAGILGGLSLYDCRG